MTTIVEMPTRRASLLLALICANAPATAEAAENEIKVVAIRDESRPDWMEPASTVLGVGVDLGSADSRARARCLVYSPNPPGKGNVYQQARGRLDHHTTYRSRSAFHDGYAWALGSFGLGAAGGGASAQTQSVMRSSRSEETISILGEIALTSAIYSVPTNEIELTDEARKAWRSGGEQALRDHCGTHYIAEVHVGTEAYATGNVRFSAQKKKEYTKNRLSLTSAARLGHIASVEAGYTGAVEIDEITNDMNLELSWEYHADGSGSGVGAFSTAKGTQMLGAFRDAWSQHQTTLLNELSTGKLEPIPLVYVLRPYPKLQINRRRATAGIPDTADLGHLFRAVETVNHQAVLLDRIRPHLEQWAEGQAQLAAWNSMIQDAQSTIVAHAEECVALAKENYRTTGSSSGPPPGCTAEDTAAVLEKVLVSQPSPDLLDHIFVHYRAHPYGDPTAGDTYCEGVAKMPVNIEGDPTTKSRGYRVLYGRPSKQDEQEWRIMPRPDYSVSVVVTTTPKKDWEWKEYMIPKEGAATVGSWVGGDLHLTVTRRLTPPADDPAVWLALTKTKPYRCDNDWLQHYTTAKQAPLTSGSEE